MHYLTDGAFRRILDAGPGVGYRNVLNNHTGRRQNWLLNSRNEPGEINDLV